MTREDAIKRIHEHMIVHKMNEPRAVHISEALDMAIKAFEQEPSEEAVSRQAVLDACDQSINIFDATDRIKELPSVKPKVKECEDCVSRKWLKNAIHNFYKGLIHTPTEEDIQAYIDVAPSVKPQPNVGRWIALENEEMETVGYYCSECDLPMETEQRTNFCPNCGAKMEESEDK